MRTYRRWPAQKSREHFRATIAYLSVFVVYILICFFFFRFSLSRWTWEMAEDKRTRPSEYVDVLENSGDTALRISSAMSCSTYTLADDYLICASVSGSFIFVSPHLFHIQYLHAINGNFLTRSFAGSIFPGNSVSFWNWCVCVSVYELVALVWWYT